TLIRLCLLRALPRDLPVSTPFMLVTVALYFAADVATARWLGPSFEIEAMLAQVPLPWGQALQATGVDTLLLPALTQATLNLRQQGRRLRQTAMALLGSGAIMAAVTLALSGVLGEAVPRDFLLTLAALW